MFIKDEKLYCLNDISIIPAAISEIEHRSECNIYDKNGYLPLFTAPMLNVVGLDSYEKYKENKIYPIIPRTAPLEDRLELCKHTWCAFGLEEFIAYFVKKIETSTQLFGLQHLVLIDIANGNMKKLIDSIKESKERNGHYVTIMAGNIANPQTYKLLAEAGADYVRCSVGTGSACITASNTSVFYPTASLIHECFELKQRYNLTAKIIMDGGMKNYSDIIKSLALGADYVMCGGLFNKMVEASGDIMEEYGNVVPQEYVIEKFKEKNFYRSFFGMSTKTAQIAMGKTTLHTSEGKYTRNKIEYTMRGWTENFTDYLRSCMSYCNVKNIENFNPVYVNTQVISHNSSNSFNK